MTIVNYNGYKINIRLARFDGVSLQIQDPNGKVCKRMRRSYMKLEEGIDWAKKQIDFMLTLPASHLIEKNCKPEVHPVFQSIIDTVFPNPKNVGK